jgi:aminoglycoside/choline kinase family phosphotransferase
VDTSKISGQVNQLAVSYFSDEKVTVTPLAQSGSARSYFRVVSGKESAIAAFSSNIPVNEAFFAFREAFFRERMPVPELYAVAENRKVWLLQDLGDIALFDLIPDQGVQQQNTALMNQYRQVLSDLIDFQLKGAEVIDFSGCVPRADFDERAIRWDLNYFKYYFIKPYLEHFDEDALEDGFDFLTEQALQAERWFFMYRDFQSRNIMIKDGKPWYIDFQGGRRGPLAYDVVSLLYQSRAKIDPGARAGLLEYYMEVLGSKKEVDRPRFREEISLFAFIRMMQVLGAYGFRGMVQHKPLFLKSIPEALTNLEGLFPAMAGYPRMAPLIDTLKTLIRNFRRKPHEIAAPLTVKVVSFSYLKAGMPPDESGNGGGFVFDCRALPNPGRHEAYRHLNGLDREVRDFLRKQDEVSEFIGKVMSIITQSVENYIDRGFEHLMIGFGCTGGQHRSVYCAGEVARRLKEKYNIHVVVQHYQKETGY